MYIVVTGGGMVGGGLVHRLLDNKHDVVLIEQDKEICDKLYAETGVVAINGSATSIEALNEAGIRRPMWWLAQRATTPTTLLVQYWLRVLRCLRL